MQNGIESKSPCRTSLPDKDFFDKLSPADERKFFEESLKFTQEYFGEKNIFSAIIHKDETTPHMHINLVPITKEGKLSAKEVVGNRKDLEQMQDKFFQKVSQALYHAQARS